MKNKNNTLRKVQLEELEILKHFAKFCDENNLKYSLAFGTLLGSVRHSGFIPWDDDIDVMMPRCDYEKFLKLYKEKNINSKYQLDCIEYSKYYWLPFAKIRNINTIYEESALKDFKGLKGIWIDIFPIDNTNDTNSEKQLNIYSKVYTIRNIISLKYNVNAVNFKNNIIKFICKLIGLLPTKLLYKYQKSVMTKENNKESKYFIMYCEDTIPSKTLIEKKDLFPTKKLTFEDTKFNVPKNYDKVLKTLYGDYMKLPKKEDRITHMPINIKLEEKE